MDKAGMILETSLEHVGLFSFPPWSTFSYWNILRVRSCCVETSMCYQPREMGCGGLCIRGGSATTYRKLPACRRYCTYIGSIEEAVGLANQNKCNNFDQINAPDRSRYVAMSFHIRQPPSSEHEGGKRCDKALMQQ